MLKVMLAWFALFAAFAAAITTLSTPAHMLPGYLPFELACLLPFSVVLFRNAARRGPATSAAALVTTAAVMAVTYPAHIVTTLGHNWAYFQDMDLLAGPHLAGVPVEEFLFYPLTINLAVLLYLLTVDVMKEKKLADFQIDRRTLRASLLGAAAVFFGLGAAFILMRDPSSVAAATQVRDAFGLPHYAEGPRNFNWTILCMFSVAANLTGLWIAELYTPMTLRAVVPVAVLFLPVCLLIDVLGTTRGWWVFNAQATSGIWIGPVPAEELPMYLTGVMMSISVFEGTRRIFGERRPA